MKMTMMLFFTLAFIIIMFSLLKGSSHFLMMLLYLEAAVLVMMLLFTSITCAINMYLPHAAMILLTLGACEASLGLSLMVCMSRHCGSNLLSALTLARC